MVHFRTFGSTGKPCYVPRSHEQQAELTTRDRRHLCNTRILGWHGISHPGLTWKYSETQNAMMCLGYSCAVYREFDLTLPDCCVSVHRSCYALLAGHLERAEGSLVGGQNLLQHISVHIDSRGVLSADSLYRSINYQPRIPPRLKLRQAAKPYAWLMCDPTDLPSIPTPMLYIDVQDQGGQRQGVDIPRGLGHSSCKLSSDEANLYLAEQTHIIPTQLLTPPPSPTSSMSEGMEVLVSRARSAVELVPERPSFSELLHLPPHILLSIVSHLPASDMLHLSQTCTQMRNYLSANSAVWTQMCRTNLAYTPKHLFNQQAAEYYLGIRGPENLGVSVVIEPVFAPNGLEVEAGARGRKTNGESVVGSLALPFSCVSAGAGATDWPVKRLT
ncbi:hypothetical protein H4R27_001137 [Coemansia aciculifera]|nr:hypothetical protein H4R27_001137 [Coemansia aciculifera]